MRPLFQRSYFVVVASPRCRASEAGDSVIADSANAQIYYHGPIGILGLTHFRHRHWRHLSKCMCVIVVVVEPRRKRIHIQVV